ncbi:MAG: hypothetical protein AAF035_13850, partial [Pseudomonadota bacterium]
LMHDIQRRTAQALPKLLSRLDREGYKVVHIKGRRAPDRLYDSAPMIAKLNSGKAPKRTAVARAKPERKTLVARLRAKHHELKKRQKTREFIAKAPAPSFDIAALMPAESVVTTADANGTDAVVTGSTNAARTKPAIEKRAPKTQTVAMAAVDQTSPRLAEPVKTITAEPSQIVTIEAPTLDARTSQSTTALKASESTRVALVTRAREPKAAVSAPTPSNTPPVSVPLKATSDETAIAMVTPLLSRAPSQVKVTSAGQSETEMDRAETVLASTKPAILQKAPASTVVVKAERNAEKPAAIKTEVALAPEPPASEDTISKPAQATSSPLRRWFQRRRERAQPSSREPTVPTQTASLEQTQDTEPDPTVSNGIFTSKPFKAEYIAEPTKQTQPVKSPLRRWFQRRREARERAREEARAAEQAAKMREPERVSSL